MTIVVFGNGDDSKPRNTISTVKHMEGEASCHGDALLQKSTVHFTKQITKEKKSYVDISKTYKHNIKQEVKAWLQTGLL